MFVESPLWAGIRFNYEKNFFHKGTPCDHDRLIVELITHI